MSGCLDRKRYSLTSCCLSYPPSYCIQIPRDVPICDFWKREGTLTWSTSDDPYHSDSDCDVEEQELRSYKVQTNTAGPLWLLHKHYKSTRGHMKEKCSTLPDLRKMTAYRARTEIPPHEKELWSYSISITKAPTQFSYVTWMLIKQLCVIFKRSLTVMTVICDFSKQHKEANQLPQGPNVLINTAKWLWGASRVLSCTTALLRESSYQSTVTWIRHTQLMEKAHLVTLSTTSISIM